jgi:hypothetical protein
MIYWKLKTRLFRDSPPYSPDGVIITALLTSGDQWTTTVLQRPGIAPSLNLAETRLTVKIVLRAAGVPLQLTAAPICLLWSSDRLVSH